MNHNMCSLNHNVCVWIHSICYESTVEVLIRRFIILISEFVDSIRGLVIAILYLRYKDRKLLAVAGDN